MRKIVFLFIWMLGTISLYGSNEDQEVRALELWIPGSSVSMGTIKKYGESRCFVSEPIPDAVFARMKGHSYKANCTVPRSQLRYLKVLHYDGHGHILLGEMVCNRVIAQELIEIFHTLFQHRYPIERMRLIDDYHADDEASTQDNNSTCFNFRKKTLAAAGLSKHAQGMAVDINTLYNPYCKVLRSGKLKVSPESGRPYVNRNAQFPYKITKSDLCYRLFVQHGFKWGGSWKSCKDYQHFEK